MTTLARTLRSIANTVRMHPKNEKALHSIANKIERLQGIVGKLPKTADGVPVVPEVDNIYMLCHNNQQPVAPRIATVHCLKIENCYSTLEAAEAAIGKK